MFQKTEKNTPVKKEKVSTTKKTKGTEVSPVRVKKDTRGILNKILKAVNKKEYGRKIKPDEIIAKALSKLTQTDYEELQQKSLSNADKLEMEMRRYSSKNGNISKDEFLGLLLNGKVQNAPA